MLLLRFLIISATLFLILLITLVKLNYLSLPLTGTVAGVIDPVRKITSGINLPKDLIKVTDFLATPSASLINLPKTEDLILLGQDLPKEIQKRLPLFLQIITNTKREELYLKSQRSFEIPKINQEDFDQEIAVQLNGFEVKDSRTSKTPWSLFVFLKNLPKSASDKNIEVSFNLKPENIEAIEGDRNDLKIEEGALLRVTSTSVKGKGHFMIRPFVKIKIPAGLVIDDKIEIESSLE